MKKEKSVKKTMADAKKERDQQNSEILKMDFDDFKKVAVKCIDEIEDCIAETVDWNADQRDMIVKFFGKEIKKINDNLNITEENFQTFNQRLHGLEVFTAMMAIKFKEALQRKSMTFEERKGLAACVSIKWGKVEEKSFNASMQRVQQ